jgi:hypothetical protein
MVVDTAVSRWSFLLRTLSDVYTTTNPQNSDLSSISLRLSLPVDTGHKSAKEIPLRLSAYLYLESDDGPRRLSHYTQPHVRRTAEEDGEGVP